jgi:hypothetical protein
MSTAGFTVPETDYVTEQCLIEHRTLGHVKAALRLALEWQVGAPGLPRKVATVRFTAQSFRRHLERLMNLEEKDGYMAIVGELKPNLVDQARRLRDEHDVFRATLARLLPQIEQVADDQPVQVESLCDDLGCLLDGVDIHDARETALLQEVMLQDDGGEGG